MAPARSVGEMQAIITNDLVDAALCALFIAVVLAVLAYGFLAVRRALSDPNITAKEMTYGLRVVRAGE
jgi:carbon starvation protein